MCILESSPVFLNLWILMLT